MSDDFRDMERHNKVPAFFLVFFFALIAWGIFYIVRYTPQISGWSQYDVLRKESEAARTAAPAAVSHENPYEGDPKAIAEGGRIYAENCAGCHGDALKGDVGPDLTGHLKYGETDIAKYDSIANGRPGGMPAFESQLGRQRIQRVLAYVDSIREKP
ncbi:MAG: c-type cytochrome [Gemmatimonadota bacterium]